MFIIRLAESSKQRGVICRERGSVMLLTVVSLLMLAILGMAYLQTTRLDQAAANTSSKSYIDMVANASIAYIGEVLKNDVVSADGIMLDKTSGIEIYDYPWTSTTDSYTVQYNDGTTDTAHGGKLDDTWLASIEPTFTGSHKGTWPHITNLNGIFLRLPASNGSETAPQELSVDNTTGSYQWRRDTQVPINVSNNSSNLDYASRGFEKIGADADGDGIEDSKWTWAPIRQVSGVSYVMAARIIDNSSLLNMNVALSQVKAKNNYDNNMPVSMNPSALDLGNFVFYNNGSSTELKKLLAYRLNTSPIAIPNTDIQIDDFWSLGALLFDNYSNSYQKLGILNELELRYRNGLNNPDIKATIETYSNGMENFLRADQSSERTYTSLSGVSHMDDYFEKDVRHQLTTVSGASIVRPALPNETPGYQTRGNLYSLLTPDASTTVPNTQTAYSYQLQQILYNFYANHPGYSPSVLDTLTKQMTVNMVDYVDADNKISCYYDYDVDGNPIAYSTTYGNEALPYITEVYTQRSYKLDVTKVDYDFYYAPFDMWIPIKIDAVTATADNSHKPGMAIEIRNPYQNSISLAYVSLWIGNHATGYEVSLDTLTGISKLKPNQILVIYSNSSDTISHSPPEHDISQIIGDNPRTSHAEDDFEIVKVEVSNLGNLLLVESEGDKDSDFSVQLRATRQDGIKLTWGYSKVPLKQYVKNPAQITLDTQWFDDNYGHGLLDNYRENQLKYQFTQTSTFANPQGLNALAYQSSEWISHTRDMKNLVGDITANMNDYMTSMDRLGLNDKKGDEDQNIWYQWRNDEPRKMAYDGFSQSKFDSDTDKWIFSNIGTTFDHVGDLLLVPIVGMQENTTFAASLTAAVRNDDLRKDYMLAENSNTYISTDSSSAYQNMNYAQALLEQFVTRSPLADGWDNDADGLIDTADDDELFIPGAINLNTATPFLLDQILPISDVDTREDVVDEIVSMRSASGIPTPSHLLNLNASAWGASANERIEKTNIQRLLGSVANTRSDIFTAYVLIRGYPTGDFRKGAVESKQYFVVFDRSKIKTANDRVQILGYYEFD